MHTYEYDAHIAHHVSIPGRLRSSSRSKNTKPATLRIESTSGYLRAQMQARLLLKAYCTITSPGWCRQHVAVGSVNITSIKAGLVLADYCLTVSAHGNVAHRCKR